MAARVRITWRKSAIGYRNNQRRTIEALGLRRLGHTVEHGDSRALRGMITKVRHLIDVTEIDGRDIDGTSAAHPEGTPPAHAEVSKE